ncbi:restriction endonuclease subunit S [Rossellomorea marisflavi]
MIETFEIPLPSIEEQKSIVNVLSTLDTKIEKNKQVTAS